MSNNFDSNETVAPNSSRTEVAANETVVSGSKTEVAGQTAVPADQTAVPADQTAVPAGQTAVSADQTANIGGAKVVGGDIPEYPFYEINGTKYEFVSVISKQSGEANVFRVRYNNKDFALKIYKRHRHPDHSVLETIKNLRGNGLLIDLYDHGLWRDANGAAYDFELMEYCSGRSLNSIKLNGNEEKFREIAVKMAAAIDFCHQHHILHRDIKPSNFIYTNDDETNFVLTDFGIGKVLDGNNRTTTDEGRTPIYAAPEMYTYIPGKPTYVTPASDFYAMGMTLLALWIGEGMLIADEVKLVKDKQEETLPYPSSKISKHTLSLIKGLTRRNSENRADYNDIVKWAKGETLFCESYNDSVRSDFRIVFSSKDNLIAHSPEELAKILWENQEMGKNYLYHEQIEKWFREMDQPETALQIHAITEDLYPGDRVAGIYATCLLLDPETPYFSLSGERIDTQEGLAKELFDNVVDYTELLKNQSHNLWIYLEHIGEDELVEEYKNVIFNNGEYGVLQLSYVLDQNLPYRMDLENNSTIFISDFDHLFRYINKGTIADDDIYKLYSDDFATWAIGRNKDLAATAITNVQNNDSISDINKGWLIAYSIGYNVGYDFISITGNNKSSLISINDLAYEIANEINGKKIVYSLAEQIKQSNFKDTRLYQYLYSHKKFNKQIEWIEYCMDLNSNENSKKYAPYTSSMAQMKTVAGLINSGFPLEIAGIKFSNLKEYESNKSVIDEQAQKDPKRFTLLQEWIALSFQEDIKCDYAKVSYFDLTKNYLKYLKDKLPYCNFAKIAKNTISKINSAKDDFEDSCNKIKRIQHLSVAFSFVPLIIVSIIAIYNIYKLDSEVFEVAMLVLGKILGIVGGIILGCVALALAGNCLIGIVAGFIGGGLIMALCNLIVPIVPFILVAVIVTIIIYFAKNIFAKSISEPYDNWSNMDLNKAEDLACIGDAFNSRNKVFPSLPNDYPVCVYTTSKATVDKQIKNIRNKALIMFAISLVSCCIYAGIKISGITEYSNKNNSIIEQLDGEYSGTFDGRNATFKINDTENADENGYITGTVTIYYRNPLVHNVVCYPDENYEWDYLFNVMNKDGSIDSKIKYEVHVTEDKNHILINGKYNNAHKGSKYKFYFNKPK